MNLLLFLLALGPFSSLVAAGPGANEALKLPAAMEENETTPQCKEEVSTSCEPLHFNSALQDLSDRAQDATDMALAIEGIDCPQVINNHQKYDSSLFCACFDTQNCEAETLVHQTLVTDFRTAFLHSTLAQVLQVHLLHSWLRAQDLAPPQFCGPERSNFQEIFRAGGCPMDDNPAMASIFSELFPQMTAGLDFPQNLSSLGQVAQYLDREYHQQIDESLQSTVESLGPLDRRDWDHLPDSLKAIQDSHQYASQLIDDMADSFVDYLAQEYSPEQLQGLSAPWSQPKSSDEWEQVLTQASNLNRQREDIFVEVFEHLLSQEGEKLGLEKREALVQKLQTAQTSRQALQVLAQDPGLSEFFKRYAHLVSYHPGAGNLMIDGNSDSGVPFFDQLLFQALSLRAQNRDQASIKRELKKFAQQKIKDKLQERFAKSCERLQASIGHFCQGAKKSFDPDQILNCPQQAVALKGLGQNLSHYKRESEAPGKPPLYRAQESYQKGFELARKMRSCHLQQSFDHHIDCQGEDYAFKNLELSIAPAPLFNTHTQILHGHNYLHYDAQSEAPLVATATSLIALESPKEQQQYFVAAHAGSIRHKESGESLFEFAQKKGISWGKFQAVARRSYEQLGPLLPQTPLSYQMGWTPLPERPSSAPLGPSPWPEATAKGQPLATWERQTQRLAQDPDYQRALQEMEELRQEMRDLMAVIAREQSRGELDAREKRELRQKLREQLEENQRLERTLEDLAEKALPPSAANSSPTPGLPGTPSGPQRITPPSAPGEAPSGPLRAPAPSASSIASPALPALPDRQRDQSPRNRISSSEQYAVARSEKVFTRAQMLQQGPSIVAKNGPGIYWIENEKGEMVMSRPSYKKDRFLGMIPLAAGISKSDFVRTYQVDPNLLQELESPALAPTTDSAAKGAPLSELELQMAQYLLFEAHFPPRDRPQLRPSTALPKKLSVDQVIRDLEWSPANKASLQQLDQLLDLAR